MGHRVQPTLEETKRKVMYSSWSEAVGSGTEKEEPAFYGQAPVPVTWLCPGLQRFLSHCLGKVKSVAQRHCLVLFWRPCLSHVQTGKTWDTEKKKREVKPVGIFFPSSFWLLRGEVVFRDILINLPDLGLTDLQAASLTAFIWLPGGSADGVLH